MLMVVGGFMLLLGLLALWSLVHQAYLFFIKGKKIVVGAVNR